MSESIVIDSDEIKELTTGRQPDRRKYTYFALDTAIKYSGVNRRDKIGDVQRIFDEFEKEYPEGDFEDWREFYYSEHDGERRLKEATEEAYKMLVKIREAIKQLDRSDVEDFVEGIALYGTYENRNPTEAVEKKLIAEIDGCHPSDSNDYNVKYMGQELHIVEKSDRSTEIDGSEPVVRFEQKEDSSIEVYLDGLNHNISDF